MNLLATIRRRLRALWLRREVKREIDEELRFHLEQRAAENIAAGAAPEEAAREARKRFGNVQSIREECRESRGASLGESWLQDIRFGLRMLRKDAGFTIVAVLTLALGIGANTAIFSVINSVLLRPLPYHDPGRIVAVTERSLKRGFSEVTVTPGCLRDWQEQNSVFEQLGGQIYESVNITGLEQSRHCHAAFATVNYFSVFGVPPLLGRTFVEADKPPGHRVVVLSYSLWQEAFGGDRGVIGRTVTLNDLVFTVIGVMPSDFQIYRTAAIFGLPTGVVTPELWTPWPQPMTERTNHYFLAFGRLKAGVPAARAQSDLTGILQRSTKDWPLQRDWEANVRPLQDEVVGSSRPALRLLLGAVGFVLLIACANVAGLSLARSMARSKEFAVRCALGASRLRLVRQLLVESVVLALLGGAVGTLLGRLMISGLVTLQPVSLPRLAEVRMDGAVLGFTLLVSVLTGLLFGVAPALSASKADIEESLKEGGRGLSDGRHRQRMRKVLLVGELALTLMLLAGAGLMIHSFSRLLRVNPGFHPERVATFDFSMSTRAYDADEAKRIRTVQQLRDRVEAEPGVKSAATVFGLPFGTMLSAVVAFDIDRRAPTDPAHSGRAAWRVVSHNYFSAMGIPLLVGRAFSQQLDRPGSQPTVIVNESFVRKFFKGEDPLGRRIQPYTLSTNWEEVVGVIQDVKLTGLDEAAIPEIYQCDSQHGPWMFSLVVRSSLPLRQIDKVVRTTAASLDRDMPAFNVRTMEQSLSASVASRRLTMMLTAMFAALALALTAVGIYGAVAYSVNQQTREIGIRMALGATRGAVLSHVLRQGMLVVWIGTGIGLAGSFGFSHLLSSQLFEVNSIDPVTFVIVPLVLTAVAVSACLVPARRATKIDPMEALRCE